MSEFKRFKEKYKTAAESIKAPQEIVKKYKDVVPDELIDLWQLHGFGGYENGLLWTVNPDEYLDQVNDWFESDFPYVVFARTAFGDLFLLYDEYNGERTIKFLDVRHADTFIISNSVMSLFNGMFLELDYFLKKIKSKTFIKVVKKLGELRSHECYGYEPILALGGSESLKNLKKVKLIPHLSILAQSAGTVE